MYIFIIVLNFLLSLICSLFTGLIAARLAPENGTGASGRTEDGSDEKAANRMKNMGKTAVTLCFAQIFVNSILMTAGEIKLVMILGYVCMAAQIAVFAMLFVKTVAIINNVGKNKGNGGNNEK